MSSAAMDALIREQRLLIAALDSDDVDAIARHSAGLGEAVVRVRALERPLADRPRVEEALRLADAARVRVNVLADLTQRRLDRLVAAAGRIPAATYGRDARLRR